ncbi:MAG TPA: cysteine--tRNA ligase [Candidatus Baltobacteraceae bacterium]|nr:cysteine--tRNA ligase [Candidatus Baltobacteraceae bacterium]
MKPRRSHPPLEDSPVITVYDTLSRTTKKLEPQGDSQFKMFVCGPTVYDYAHLGHGKNYTQFDFIAKYLRFRGFNVYYLQNITDIEDKIIARAKRDNVSAKDLAEQFERSYLEDMDALRNNAVTKYARATDYIEPVVNQVQRLVDRGFAYKTSDGFYFDISRFPSYGALSGRSGLDQENTVSRIEINPEKRNAGDFVLWKFRKPEEPFWPSILGEGRPGWHIEDTAITEHHFGPQYDLHGGGIDLIFPHHEAEIAQIETASGISPMVRFWLHGGFLNINAGKMSKSEANFITIRDALQQTSSAALRYWFISQHYRSAIELTDDWPAQAEGGLARMNNFVRSIDPTYDDVQNEKTIENVRRNVIDSLDNDFDTPGAFASIYEFIKGQYRSGKPGRFVMAFMKELNGLFDFIEIDQKRLLSVNGCSSQTQVESDRRRTSTIERDAVDQAKLTISEDKILRLIDERQKLRAARSFEAADNIRLELSSEGIVLEDTPSGVKWSRRSSHGRSPSP